MVFKTVSSLPSVVLPRREIWAEVAFGIPSALRLFLTLAYSCYKRCTTVRGWDRRVKQYLFWNSRWCTCDRAVESSDICNTFCIKGVKAVSQPFVETFHNLINGGTLIWFQMWPLRCVCIVRKHTCEGTAEKSSAPAVHHSTMLSKPHCSLSSTGRITLTQYLAAQQSLASIIWCMENHSAALS